MDHGGPVAYEGTGVIPQAKDELYDTTRQWDIHATYDNGVTMHFMDKQTADPVVKAYHYVVHDHGTVFHGENGWIGVDRSAMYSHNNNALRNVTLKDTDKRLPVSDSHFGNYLDCVRSRQQAISPFEAAIRSDTISHLSEIVIRSGSPLKWNPEFGKNHRRERGAKRVARPADARRIQNLKASQPTFSLGGCCRQATRFRLRVKKMKGHDSRIVSGSFAYEHRQHAYIDSAQKIPSHRSRRAWFGPARLLACQAGWFAQ